MKRISAGLLCATLMAMTAAAQDDVGRTNQQNDNGPIYGYPAVNFQGVQGAFISDSLFFNLHDANSSGLVDASINMLHKPKPTPSNPNPKKVMITGTGSEVAKIKIPSPNFHGRFYRGYVIRIDTLDLDPEFPEYVFVSIDQDFSTPGYFPIFVWNKKAEKYDFYDDAKAYKTFSVTRSVTSKKEPLGDNHPLKPTP